jgi:hypothetical protein
MWYYELIASSYSNTVDLQHSLYTVSRYSRNACADYYFDLLIIVTVVTDS